MSKHVEMLKIYVEKCWTKIEVRYKWKEDKIAEFLDIFCTLFSHFKLSNFRQFLACYIILGGFINVFKQAGHCTKAGSYRNVTSKVNEKKKKKKKKKKENNNNKTWCDHECQLAS